MNEIVLSNDRLADRDTLARRVGGKLQLSTTIALVVLLALAVIAVSIGIAQAETLGAMVDDEIGRLALFGLVLAIIMTGGITATIMWATAPLPRPIVNENGSERLAARRPFHSDRNGNLTDSALIALLPR
jgi:hypothetical protein